MASVSPVPSRGITLARKRPTNCRERTEPREASHVHWNQPAHLSRQSSLDHGRPRGFFHVCAGYSGIPEFFVESQAGGAVQILHNIIAGLPGRRTADAAAEGLTVDKDGDDPATVYVSTEVQVFGLTTTIGG